MSSGLPIEAVLGELETALRAHSCAVLQAPPGAGKTTRVPLFLHEQGLYSGKILMLEPRRLATRAAAERMADMIGQEAGQSVGFRMRGANKTSKDTKIEVVTEGILTRMIQSDPELSGISCIIFDEFHERSLQADLGLALALEVKSALREDLHLIVMSATLDAAPVAKLLGDAPLITSQGVSYDVEERYLGHPWKTPNTRNPRLEPAFADFVYDAVQNTQGGVLVFLPGAGEINRVADLLRSRLPKDVALCPLYGAMPFAEQRRALTPDPNKRKLVLATSIAETSLTIPEIRVVIDAGLSRRASFDAGSGMARLITQKVTKAEARQRMGRAGRVASGICYKFWTKGENGGLAAFPPPEIRSADLSNFTLELAQWGVNSPDDLALLDPPRDSDFSAAQDILKMLGALSKTGHITDYGRKLSREPMHPRLAHVMHQGSSDATLFAAMFEEQDILDGPPHTRPTDLELRWKALQGAPHGSHRVNHQRMKTVKSNAKRLKAKGKLDLSFAQMAALAYPDRIAMRRASDGARYILANGKGAVLGEHDAMNTHRFLVATNLDGDPREAKIRQAVAFSEADLTQLFADQITDSKTCHWNSRTKRIEALIERGYGAVTLSTKPWTDCPDAAYGAALFEGLHDRGFGAFKLSKPIRLFLARVNWLAERSDQMPDMSADALMDSLDVWLAPHLAGCKTIGAVQNLDLSAILRGHLTWDQMQLLDTQAPESITAPTGTKMRVDYGGAAPSISVRLQELFGLDRHPTLGPDRIAVAIELLSPAQRPVQITADLPGFWRTSYADVRKDMRGRYPRHPWPIDPLEASPTRRVKPR